MDDRPPHGTGFVRAVGYGIVFWLVAWIIYQVVSSALAETYIVDRNDRGGITKPYYDRMINANRNGDRIEIRNDVCMSACTFYLGAWDVCVMRKTRFGFHGMTRWFIIPNRKANPALASLYPAPLDAWFLENVAGQQTKILTGAELIDTYQFEECPND